MNDKSDQKATNALIAKLGTLTPDKPKWLTAPRRFKVKTDPRLEISIRKPPKPRTKTKIQMNVMKLPSFEQIVEDQKKYAIHRQKVQELKQLFDETVGPRNSTQLEEMREKESPILDCRGLSEAELQLHFTKLKGTLMDIIRGTVSNEAHKIYNEHMLSGVGNYSHTACFKAFTQSQIDCLVGLIEKLDGAEPLKYIFNVLLPEICLLIFMNLHQKTRPEANFILKKQCIIDAGSF